MLLDLELVDHKKRRIGLRNARSWCLDFLDWLLGVWAEGFVEFCFLLGG